MSYTAYVDKPVSEKIVLVEIDPLEDGDLWVNVQPGIWAVTYSVNVPNTTYNFGAGAFGYGAFGSAGVATLTNSKAASARVNSFYDGTIWYSKVTALTTLRTTESAFYYDSATKILYVHFTNLDPPDAFPNIKLGVSIGYANKGCYYDGIYYDARVLSVPAVGRSKDPLFFGKITFDGGTISLINSDGAFDAFQADHEIYGSAIRILLGFEDNAYTDFKTLYEGYIENLRLSEDVFEIEANDKRKALSRKLPTAVFDTTTYPNLKGENAGKPIPLGYGSIKNAPVICVNENGTTPWTFKICDTTHRAITSVDAVYVKGGTARTSVAWSGTSLTLATFQLTAGVYTALKDEVTVDFQGYASGGTLITNGLEIVRDILTNHFARPYTATFYNTTAWDSAETVAADVAIFVNEVDEGWKIIEEISYSLHGNFIVQDDGKFTFRAYDAARAVDQTVYYWELLDQLLEVGYNIDEVLSSCRVGYAKDWAEKSFTTLVHNTEEVAVVDKFKFYREKTFDTLLTANGSAETFAAAIMAISADVRPIFRAKTKMQSIDRELSDMVNVQYKPENRAFVGWMSAEVIGKTVDLDAMTVELTLRKT